MESDEQKYYNPQNDVLDLNENGSTNDKMSYNYISFNILKHIIKKKYKLFQKNHIKNKLFSI